MSFNIYMKDLLIVILEEAENSKSLFTIVLLTPALFVNITRNNQEEFAFNVRRAMFLSQQTQKKLVNLMKTMNELRRQLVKQRQ